MFMTANGLTEADIMAQGDELAFPESVIDLFSGQLGQPPGGFPKELGERVLKGRKPLTEPPGAALKAIDFDREIKEFHEEFGTRVTELDYLSYKMYPKVFRGYFEHRREFGEVHYLPTQAFFYGLKQGDEILVKLQRGKTIVIRFLLPFPYRRKRQVPCKFRAERADP